jgi:subtilisin-like proprotein convertase family protein
MKRTHRWALAAPIAALALLGLAAPASAKTKTATKTVCVPGGALPNTDHSFVQLPVSLGKLPKKAKITDVNASLRATSNDATDIHAYLASPAGRLAMLIDSERSIAGTAFGTGPGCGGSPTSFDDEAAVTVDTGTNPFTGNFKPFTPLSVMDGGPAAGTFRLIVEDLNSGPPETQSVDGGSVTVAYSYPVKKKKKKKKSKKSAASAKAKFVNRTGSKDVCLPLSVPVNNNQPADDRATINPVTIATGKLPKGAKVTDVDVRVRMTHTYRGDIEFFLFSPGGGFVPVWIGQSETQPDWGSGATDCTGSLTVFDDEAPTSIVGSTAPSAGAFQPLTPLSALDGLLAGGAWTLYANDHYTGDQGTLQAVGLNIDYRYRAKKKAKK